MKLLRRCSSSDDFLSVTAMKKSPFSRPRRSLLLAGLVASSMTAGLWVGQVPPAQALSWLDLLRGGIQIFQGVQLSNLSDEDETKLGKQINEQLLKREFKLYKDDPALVDYVKQVGARVAQASQREKLTYTVQVVEDDAINAFATAGGFVYVTTGLLETAENEAELAGVLGHEIGHVEGRHLINAMSREAWRRGVMTAAGVDQSTAVQIGVELAMRRPGSRQNEYDADLRGLRIMREANYAESGMVSFMKKLQAASQGAPPSFLSTHPATGDRVRTLNSNLSEEQTGTDGLDPDYYRNKTQALRRDGDSATQQSRRQEFVQQQAEREQHEQEALAQRAAQQRAQARNQERPQNRRVIRIRIGR